MAPRQSAVAGCQATAIAYACVDIGSNTTRLLVAELDDGRLRELMTQRVYNRLGHSLAERRAIPDDKLAETVDAVATQVRHAREFGVERLAIVATAAIRDAPNRDQLVDAIGERTSCAVRVLGGSDEAELAFLGATKTLGAPVDGPVAVVDVGGGSSEIAVGTVADGVEWVESFRVGSGFLAESYLRSDPPSAHEVHAVREHIAGVFEGLELPRSDHAVAVGGSATSLRKMIGAELTHDSLERGVRILCSTEIAEVARRFELDPRRVRLLPAGMLILEQVSDCLALPLTIGGGGLREGVIIELVAAHAAEAAI